MNIINRISGLSLIGTTKWTESNTIDQIAYISINLEFENLNESDEDLIGLTIAIGSDTYEKIKNDLPWYDGIVRSIEEIKEMNEKFGNEPKQS